MTLSFDIPPEAVVALRDGARDASIAAAKAYGFGGEAWSVERLVPPSGVGPKTRTSISGVTGYAYRQRPGPVATALAQTRVLADTWHFLLLEGEAQQGDIITSDADAGYQFTLETAEPWYTYTRFQLERQR